MATLVSGRPTEEVYREFAKDPGDDEAEAVSVLVRSASDTWYERACQEIIDPLLNSDTHFGLGMA